ncbi:MAG: family 65 glycosyl hydrolase domain-containing protein [Flavobacteriales bacterium]
MIRYLQTHPWKVIQKGFDPKHQRSSESIFSIGNGRFGQRANHEESYSGETLQGSYVGGVYYPDKTRVGWWKNGYPDYFAKVLNSTSWIGIRVWVDNVELDLAACPVIDFYRELDMRRGLLTRRFSVTIGDGRQVDVEAMRFCSVAVDSSAAIRYAVTPVNFSGTVRFESYLEGDVKNHDANYDEKFWTPVEQSASGNKGSVVTRTRKTEFELGVAMVNTISREAKWTTSIVASRVACHTEVNVPNGHAVVLHKYVGIVSSLNAPAHTVGTEAMNAAQHACETGFEMMREAHEARWYEIWSTADIRIDGDAEAQQGIRFNIFQLNQTYTGEDSRLNIGPKGFTGEKYGGSTYWDTEAYCLPFYMSTKPHQVARQLLVYRYQQLQKAIENAAKLGFTNGAALYPMVTMNGEECHNEWEITFEEIHRNGAIAYGIWNYVKYTGEWEYLAEYGLDVLIGIARFWAQRVNFSEARSKYVMLGVTGPNEYENNVNNNWYTNYIATWCMKWCMEAMDYVKKTNPAAYSQKLEIYDVKENEERAKWSDIIAKMYYPTLDGTRVFLQQDGFMDKEQLTVKDLNPAERPINQHWSWDRILRSIFIKQADVLQGIYFFEDDFTKEELKENFDFYEPRTVHESSLSPCVHAILAAKLGYEEKAYEMYMRTSRLDLDDYNHEAHEGLHITSMAGTWMSVVQGFGGMRVEGDELTFSPMLPKQWTGYQFKVLFRNRVYNVIVDRSGHRVEAEA